MATQLVTPAVPGPSPIPLLGWRGNLFQFYRDPLAYMWQLYRTYGEIAGYVAGRNGFVFAFGPTYNHQILSNPDLFHSYLVAIPFPPDSAAERLNSGLICMNGERHRQHRRLIQPTFHKQQVETYRDDMVLLTERMLEQWRPGMRLDIERTMQQLTMRIAAKTLFGLDSVPDAQRIGRIFIDVLDLASSPVATFAPVNVPGSPYARLLATAERAETHLRAMIGAKRTATTRTHDVLTTLIHTRDETGETMTDAELVGHAYVLFTAGHETTSNALTWALFLLSQHPQVLMDLTDEVQGLLRGAAPTVAQLGQLPLLERVIKESMRLLPPAYVGGRRTTEPVHVGPYPLPEGATVLFSQYITHRLPDLYPEPQRFLPDRWQSISPSIYEYLPFGAGARMCIGATFAMMELKIVLAMLLQRYWLTLTPGARIARQVTINLSPRYGMPMTVGLAGQPIRHVAVRGNIREMVDLED